jgi:hypothetical protein
MSNPSFLHLGTKGIGTKALDGKHLINRKGFDMKPTNAAKFYTAMQKEQALMEKKQAEKNIVKFLELAKERGYDYTEKEIRRELRHLSEEELASLLNPGVGPRHHLLAR